jgi:hypothetical protein
MFKCKECGSTDFKLVVQPGYKGQINISHNDHNEVVVMTNQQEFVADLMFMNQFAVCRQCDGIKSWEYFFRKRACAM